MEATFKLDPIELIQSKGIIKIGFPSKEIKSNGQNTFL